MIKTLGATAIAFALLIGAAAHAAHAAPTYGFSTAVDMTNPFQAEDR